MTASRSPHLVTRQWSFPSTPPPKRKVSKPHSKLEFRQPFSWTSLWLGKKIDFMGNFEIKLTFFRLTFGIPPI